MSRGHSLLEQMLFILLLGILALAVFLLSETGSEAYLSMHNRQQADLDLRIGLSYLDVKLRKHDHAGSISIVSDPFSGHPAIHIREVIEDTPYVTWIYFHQGQLRELLIAEREQPKPEMGLEIVQVDSFTVRQDGAGLVKLEVGRLRAGRMEQSSRQVLLRSSGGQP